MNRAFELRVIDLLNAERARHGLGPLAEEPCPALDRGRTSFRAHTGDDSALPLDHIAQKRGEQCQFGSGTEYPTPDDAIIGWMGIPPHRAILLQPEVTRIGFGVHPVAGDPHAYAIVRVPGHPPRAASPPAAVERVLMERIAARRATHGAPPLTRNSALDRVAQRAWDRLDLVNRTDGAPSSHFCSSPYFIKSQATSWATQEGYAGTLYQNGYLATQVACVFDDLNGRTAQTTVERIRALAVQNPDALRSAATPLPRLDGSARRRSVVSLVYGPGRSR